MSGFFSEKSNFVLKFPAKVYLPLMGGREPGQEPVAKEFSKPRVSLQVFRKEPPNNELDQSLTHPRAQ
jgi:hypothetical protein